MEFIGLVIVVILVTLGILFYIQFSIKQERTQTTGGFKETQLVKNTLNSLLRTSVACPTLDANVDVTSLVQDCVAFQELDCDLDGSSDSCEKLEEVAGEILDGTLKSWNQRYYIQIRRGNTVALNYSYRGCPGTRESATYPIPSRGLGGEKIIAKLDICN